tara:strand:+ start:507 stop:1457 length:951 start_codon:yes stop_codon:yes gene_type:complete
MKIEYSDILNKHKGKPCFVALHGPSLTSDIKFKTQKLQKEEKLLRISVNNWFDFFDVKPDYWVVSNGEFTIENSMIGSMIWNHHGYEQDCFNKYKVPLFYNSNVDFTTQEFIDKNLMCDYFPYDNRHFKKHSCKEILSNFKNFVTENKNLNYEFYGNNAQMWQRPITDGFPEWKKKIYGKIAGSWNANGKCCERKLPTTLQEQLQNLTGHSQHMSPGHTVGMFALAFAVLMGCNPIYFAGMDLDYEKGYSKSDNKKHAMNGLNEGHYGHCKHIFRNFLLSDMKILKESSEMMGTKIINLSDNSWYNIFEFGMLPEE